MCFKRVRRIGFGCAVAAALIAAAPRAAALQNHDRLADGIVAVVNDRIITLVDVQVVEAFGLAETVSPAGSEAARREILEKLINQKVVLGLSRSFPAAEPERMTAEIGRLKDRLGEEGLRAALERFGFTEADLQPYLEEKMRVEAVIADRFSRSVTVSLAEIEARYESDYVPAESAAGRIPRPFLEAADGLELSLKEEKITAQSALWIQSLREQAEIEIRLDVLKN